MGTLQTILVASARIEAAITILSVLLVVSVVGYISALAYYRSSFMKLIRRLRTEKDEMKRQINNLNHEKKKLVVNLGEREKQIENLSTKINTLKSLYESPIHETDILVRSSQSGPKKSNETLAHK